MQTPLETAATANPLLRGLDTLVEVFRLEAGPPAPFATPNTVALDLKTMRLWDYSVDRDNGAVPIIVHAPFAGHSSAIADFHARQSLMGCLRQRAPGALYLTDWKSAGIDIANFSIDEYRAELVVAIDHAGGRTHLVGLCQGGWAAAMLAARFPEKVASLVLAGAPLDLDAGDGAIKRAVHTLSPVFYEQLVALGGGLMRGRFMLQGFKNMHPLDQYVEKYVHLHEHVDEPDYRERLEAFSAWFEHPIDMPGRWYLEVVRDLFHDNLFFEGRFAALGRTVGAADIRCPTYLLAGEDDAITPPVQVTNAAWRLGTPPGLVQTQVAPGGHVGLFMSHKSINDVWPGIARWIRGTEGAARAEKPAAAGTAPGPAENGSAKTPVADAAAVSSRR